MQRVAGYGDGVYRCEQQAQAVQSQIDLGRGRGRKQPVATTGFNPDVPRLVLAAFALRRLLSIRQANFAKVLGRLLVGKGVGNLF